MLRVARLLTNPRRDCPILAVMLSDIIFRNPGHAVNFNLHRISVGQRIGDLVNGFFVHLQGVNRQPRPGEEFLVAHMTLEVFRLLVLNENLLVVKLTPAIPLKE